MWCPWKTGSPNKCVCMYLTQYTFLRASCVVIVVKNLPTSAGDLRDVDSIPGSGRPPGGGHGNLLQCSCLEHPRGRGLQSTGSQRVRRSWSDLAHTDTFLQIQDWHAFIKGSSSVQFSRSVVSDSLRSQELQHMGFPGHHQAVEGLYYIPLKLDGLWMSGLVEYGEVMQQTSATKSLYAYDFCLDRPWTLDLRTSHHVVRKPRLHRKC